MSSNDVGIITVGVNLANGIGLITRVHSKDPTGTHIPLRLGPNEELGLSYISKKGKLVYREGLKHKQQGDKNV